MTCFRPAWCCAIGILLCLGASGCLPSGESQLDEQKEPHFLTGRSRVSQMDFQGAIDSFEKALEVNPRSASAHFELGCLYEADDPAAAIYHYERVVKLRPRSSEAELAREHTTKCKLELARTVSSLGPLPPSTQMEMEKILLENRDLKAQLTRWETTYSGRPPAPAAATAPMPDIRPAQPVAEPVQPKIVQTALSQTAPANASHSTPGPAGARTHIVKAGEYPAAIARKYGISVSVLMAANPEAKPTHLRVGQVLNVPVP